jgi:dTDP-4-dehydrorhamnose reductase
MTVLVLGSSGQVATHLKERLPDAVFWGRAHFDLERRAGLADAIAALKPALVVNAAAYTAVDKAETDRNAAWRLNADAVAAAAVGAASTGAPLLQLSTDYVFDGSKSGPYLPGDPVAPLGVYGLTKLGGELAVRSLNPRHWIFRTSWVFSEHGNNFVKTMLRLARAGTPLRVVADQRGVPTYADDLAALIAELARRPDALPFGTYHAVGGPAGSWHEFAETIFRYALARGLLDAAVTAAPITTAEYPTPAKRPKNSVLEASPELERLGVRFDWQRGLERCLERLDTQSRPA